MEKKTNNQTQKNKSILELAIADNDLQLLQRIAFFSKFQAFQSELPEIKKTVSVITPEGEYQYAPLNEIIKRIRPLLSKYKLCYRFDFSETDEGIVCKCYLTDAETGYEISNTMKSGKDITMRNEIHAIGSTMTYLQRYTLIALLGIATADDDNNGNTSGLIKKDSEIPFPSAKENTNNKTNKKTNNKTNNKTIEINLAGLFDDSKNTEKE